MYKKNKKPRKISRDYLRRAAYRYLERYATTEANFRQVLRRKLTGRSTEEQTEPERQQALDWIEEIVADSLKQGFVDDENFARARVASLFRSGNSTSRIKQKLHAKGVSGALTEQLLAENAQNAPDSELKSAVRYAKRRRFGPFALHKKTDDDRKRQFAAMARAGFSYDLTRRVMEDNPAHKKYCRMFKVGNLLHFAF